MGAPETALERVLHVEDDASIRMVASVALEKVGKLKVLSCEGGAQALALAADFDPQIILLDVMMPQMDGPATLQQLKQRLDLSARLVLFMTAKVQQQEQDYYQSIGAFGVIIKPFDPMTLAAQLQQHWERFQAGKAIA